MRAVFLLFAISSVASAVRHASISGQVALRRKSKSNLESGGWVDNLGDDIGKGFKAVGEGIKDDAVETYDDVKTAAIKVGDYVKKQFGKCHLCNDFGSVIGDGIQALLDASGEGEVESGALASAIAFAKLAGLGLVQDKICNAASTDFVEPVLKLVDHITIAGFSINFNASAAASCFGSICGTVWNDVENSLGQDLAGLLVSMITEGLCGCPDEFAGCIDMFDPSSASNLTQVKNHYQNMPAPTNRATATVQNCERTYGGSDYSECGCSVACLNLFGTNEGAGTCRQGCGGSVSCSSAGCGCAPACLSEGFCPTSCGQSIWEVGSL